MKMFICLVIALLFTTYSAFADVVPVHITGTKKSVDFKLETAITPAAREYGLMQRKTLQPYDGMLFVFPHSNRIAFWMKNTLIPLDMVFIDAKGTIVRIATNATPLSLEPIDSQKPALSVIELAGGRAASSGIAVGDKVTYTLPATLHVE